ncbi:Lrp/AsnC family transcriptional regulator [Methanobrevibacter sp. TMH8]|uniref:Lrp/AsnC family transcriptional regulator n=1 Tax=Methanobrevibacter sp. TMH8 TaxID=2848611 RepID=UPI001CCC5063|nr:Lrp/AsnC family transcriptional regulator [Methanobrevibacter sp. TMH8]MBZ9571452.1 Lrp/AsnC family transcriptional regulator [Methanobrevibacter sp. TMH8]
MSNDNKENVVVIDKTDKNIIEMINEDARTPYRQISRELDISVGTVHNRVDKLMKTGVIKKFAPIMDHRKLGYGLTSIIGVRVKGGQLENWEEKESFNKHVLAIYDVTGEYDAFLIAKFKNTDELDKFVKELLKEPGVERTYTQTVLNVVKEEPSSIHML